MQGYADDLLTVTLLALAIVGALMLGNLRRSFALPLLIAAFVRTGLTLTHLYLFRLPDSFYDAVMFERRAWALALDRGAGVHHPIGLDGDLFAWLLSHGYEIAGRQVALGHAVNNLCGVLLVWFGAALAQRLWGERSAKTAAWLMALHPLMALYSANLVREPQIAAPLTASLYFSAAYVQDRRPGQAFAAVLCLAMSACFHLGMRYVAALVFPALLFSFVLRALSRRPILRQSLGVLLVLGGLVTLSAVAPELYRSMNPEFVAEAQSYRSLGRARYLTGITADSPLSLLLQVPLRLFFFAYSPMPWTIAAPLDVFGFIDAIVWMFLSYRLWRARTLIRTNSAARTVLWLGLFVATVFAVPTSNTGTAVRHRTKFVAIVIAAVPWTFRRREAPHPATAGARVSA